MELLIIRHAAAEDRARFALTGRPDAERPLSEEGQAKLEAAITGLITLVPKLDRLGNSPLVRARQSAQLISKSYGGVPHIEDVEALEPKIRLGDVVRWLSGLPDEESVGLVGHEPDLGMLVAWLILGTDRPFLKLKKAGVCSLSFRFDIGPGLADLNWALQPRHLRSLAQ